MRELGPRADTVFGELCRAAEATSPQRGRCWDPADLTGHNLVEGIEASRREGPGLSSPAEASRGLRRLLGLGESSSEGVARDARLGQAWRVREAEVQEDSTGSVI